MLLIMKWMKYPYILYFHILFYVILLMRYHSFPFPISLSSTE
jgi:hypothetical protein